MYFLLLCKEVTNCTISLCVVSLNEDRLSNATIRVSMYSLSAKTKHTCNAQLSKAVNHFMQLPMP